MQTNDHKIRDYSAVLDAQYGAPGTPERAKFDEEAYTFYTSQILLDARKNARLTQEELAERIGVNKGSVAKAGGYSKKSYLCVHERTSYTSCPFAFRIS